MRAKQEEQGVVLLQRNMEAECKGNHSGTLITAIVINYRSARETIQAVKSLLHGFPEGVICPVVIENASGGEDREILEAQLPESAKLIVSDRNRGYAGGIQLGMGEVEGEYVLIFNPDTFLKPGALEEMIQLLKDQPRAGVVGPQFLDSEGNPTSSARHTLSPLRILKSHLGFWQVDHTPPMPGQPFKTGWVVGAFMLFKRAAIEAVGGFDEQYFLYYEETDLCRRLIDAGWEVWSQPKAKVVHAHGPSAERSGEVLLGREILRFYLPSRRRYLVRFHGKLAAFFVDGGIIIFTAAVWLRNTLQWWRPMGKEKRKGAAILLKAYWAQI